MKPILYTSVTEGTVPSNYGVGVLSDCISCKVTEARNGSYELEMEYAANGIHASEIQVNTFLKVKPNFTDALQLFRIYKVGKVMNGRFTVSAQHISYDLSGKLISSGSAANCAAACALLQAQAGNFTINTDKTTTANFRVSEPSSVRSWFGGKAGSLLDVYGGEWKYDNYTASLKQNRGADRGVQIRYGKNLTDLSQELDIENLCTSVTPYYIDQDGNQTVGAKVSTGLSLDVPRDIAVDFSNDVDEESSTPILTQLANLANSYISNNNFTTPTDSIKLDFVQLSSLAERVDLCDTVHIYFEALGVSTSAKCIETVWDVLEERYTSTTFGDTRTNIADTILEQKKELEIKPTTSMMDRAIERATELITGNLGGYVVIHDSNGDGEPDEILIMNTPNINTATAVWRWNQQGLGYATSYAGPYGLAMTSAGEIVADFVTTGTMSANRVRTGLIASTNNLLQIDLDNGTITAPSITLQGQDVGSTLNSLVQTSVVTTYALSNTGTVIPSSFPLSQPTTPTEQQPYLWSKTVYTYANNQTSVTYGVSVRGNNGTNGQDGAGLAILGNYDTMADLIAAHPTGSAGDAYMVGTDLAVWNTSTNSWEDVGRIQGPSGFDGLWLAIENDDDGTNANVTYTVKLLKGVTDVTTTYDAVFVWQLVKESGVTEIDTNTDTITVARDSADYGATIRCICIAILTEEVMEDYGYNAIQDYSNNDIQIIGSNTVKLIGESEIYKPYAISSQFQVVSDQISSKVSQTDFNSLSGTVTTQGTLIQQNANAILLKANTSTVNTALNGKMGTDMSNRASSILVDSGQIRFDSNSLVVNSSQFTLDASGNAVFKGKLNAAQLYIGGEYVGLGTAISDAESSAISAAAIDATEKANNAQDAAINAAAADATTKANNAKTDAINVAEGYADSVSGSALENANLYTDGQISNVNQSLVVMEGLIATKVSQTAFNQLANVVSNQGTAIDQNAQAISLKASQSDLNTLSNTVSTQQTEITQNAQAITLKASQSEVDSLSSTVSSQGTAINGKMATDMSNRASSITINSGEIKFTTDTFSVNATNLEITKTGLVTANYFKAKNTLRVVNASNVILASIEAATNGGMVAIGRSDGQQVGTFFATSSGSDLSLGNLSGTETIRLNGGSGQIRLKNASSKEVVTITSDSDGGVFKIRDENANVGYQVACTSEGGGTAVFVDSDNVITIQENGQTGYITCVRVNQTSSRKVKENIKPIEDADKILELQAVSFDYKDRNKGTDMRGFIAEDVAEVLPNLVTEETKDAPASLDYVSMIPYLQDVIKRQEERIKALEEKIDKLMEKEI